MLLATRTTEGWSALNLVGAFALVFVVVLAAVWAIYVIGRR